MSDRPKTTSMAAWTASLLTRWKSTAVLPKRAWPLLPFPVPEKLATAAAPEGCGGTAATVAEGVAKPTVPTLPAPSAANIAAPGVPACSGNAAHVGHNQLHSHRIACTEILESLGEQTRSSEQTQSFHTQQEQHPRKHSYLLFCFATVLANLYSVGQQIH